MVNNERRDNKMPTLEKVTDLKKMNEFCLTDCGPSEGCNPDDNDDFNLDDLKRENK